MLAKRSFHVYAADRHRQRVFNKRLTRAGLRRLIAQLAPCTIATEARGNGHEWARGFRDAWGELRCLLPNAMSATGVRRAKAASFLWVKVPPGNFRSSRKQSEQSWR